ncbi:MAG: AMP-binding protein [Pseudorhodoplanes sp.]
MLDQRADTMGDKTFVVFDTGLHWTYAEARKRARQTAAALHKLGVRRGDPVLVWLPNGPDIVRISLAASYLGAIFVPMNLALRGKVLEHIVTNSGARCIICHAELLDRIPYIDRAQLEVAVTIGKGPSVETGLKQLDESALNSADELTLAPDPPLQPWDTWAIFYTSGTTGASKGVISPYLHVYSMAVLCVRFVGAADRFLINVPYFHIAGALVPYVVLDRGASMAVLTEFRTSEFWDRVRETASTCCMFVGATPNFLLKQPPQDSDTKHPLRKVLMQPLVYDPKAFAQRFNIEIFTGYDMSELGPPIVADALSNDQATPKGFCGYLRSGEPQVDVRLVDAFDQEVPIGAVGEIIVRSKAPWVITPGYHRMPEATAAAWRNGWFHTGDALRRDEEGRYFFVDRVKDSIRRRGENISSAEVEADVLSFDAVGDVSAIAVPGQDGEDEVLVAVQPKPGRTIDPSELLTFLLPRMPHYMVPRYIRIMETMPRTQTDKVQKQILRSQGVTTDTWDREKAGIIIRRDRLTRLPQA